MQAKPTAATYTLRDPVAVSQFLSQLVAWGHTSANDWQSCGGCNGWELDKSAAAPPRPIPRSPFRGTDHKPSNGLPDGWRHAPSGNTVAETVHGLRTHGASESQDNGTASHLQDAGVPEPEGPQKLPSATRSQSKHHAASQHDAFQKLEQQPSAVSSENGSVGTSQHEASQKPPQQPAQQMQEAQEALRQQLRPSENGSGKLRSQGGDGQKRRPDWKWDQPLDTWYERASAHDPSHTSGSSNE